VRQRFAARYLDDPTFYIVQLEKHAGIFYYCHNVLADMPLAANIVSTFPTNNLGFPYGEPVEPPG